MFSADPDHTRLEPLARRSLHQYEVVVSNDSLSRCSTQTRLPTNRYYDDKLPAAYQPELFHAPLTEMESALKYADLPAEIHIGSVDTGHHSLSVKIKTLIDAPHMSQQAETTAPANAQFQEHVTKAIECVRSRGANGVVRTAVRT